MACLFVICTAAWAAGPAGLVAEWNFDEGRGDVARDAGGYGRDARIHGATWVKQGKGFALSLDGKDDYVDCGETKSWGIVGPVTVEAWIKPTRVSKADAMIFGQSIGTYLVTLAGDDLYWYIGAGSNHLYGKPTLGQWNHVAATFDGKRMGLWINGRQAGNRESAISDYEPGGHVNIGTKGRPDLAKFEGMVDRARIYSRALTDEEVLAHIKQEAADYGVELRAIDDEAKGAPTRFFREHLSAIDVEELGDSILFANQRVGLELRRSARGFHLNRFYGIDEGQDFLTGGVVIGKRNIFEVMMTLDPKHVRRDERWNTKPGLFATVDQMAGDAFAIGSHAAKSISWRREGNDTESRLHLEWKGIDVREDAGTMDVEVTITLRAGDPLSYWRIAVNNRSQRYGIERVRFPILNLAPIGKAESNVLVLPRNRGELLADPFGQRPIDGYYPHDFNMQFQALYDGPSGKGIFLGTRDPAPCLMNIQIATARDEIVWRPAHFPPNITFSAEDFALPYDCVVGPFGGDWFDACQIYRQWAIKQPWCRKGPLSTRQDIPKWYKEAPLYFYTELSDSAEGTHSSDENMRIAADHFREFLKWTGMRLPANWYSWKDYQPGLTTYDVPFNLYRVHTQGRWAGLPVGNAHDGNYPRIGALQSFSEQCKRLRDEGGMVCPYVALEIFDQGPSENSPYATEAKPHIVRDLYGALRTWGAETSWQPCPWTPWWRDRMTETCALMLQRENVGGFYLDVMQGSGPPCYWTPHGHSAGGGGSTTVGMHELVEMIHAAVKARDPDAITTGENSGENMIDVIDGVLQLTLTPGNIAPVFAAVYQDYIPRYGIELSTGVGWGGRYKDVWRKDQFFIECASLFTEGAQVGRLRLRPRDMSLSFQKPEHKEMLVFLGRLVGYYKQEATRKFLAYGQLMRPLEFRDPSPVPMLSYKDVGRFPALMSGVFRCDDGELGIFVVNAGAEVVEFQAQLDPGRHGMSAGAVVGVDTVASDGTTRNVASGIKGVVLLKGSLPARGATMFRVKPAAR